MSAAAFFASVSPGSFLASAAPVALNPETWAYIPRCQADAAFAALALTEKWAWFLNVDAAITALKVCGRWATLGGYYIFSAPTRAVALLDIKGLFNAWTVGNPTFTSYVGFQLIAASGSYIDTGAMPGAAGTQFSLTSHSMFYWSLSQNLSEATWAMATVTPGSTSAHIALRTRNGKFGSYRDDSSSNTAAQFAVASSSGSYVLSRTAANALYVGKATSYIDDTASALPVLPTSTIRFGEYGTGGTFSNDLIAEGGFGAGCAKTVSADAYTARLMALIAIGVISSDDPPAPEAISTPNYFTKAMSALIRPAGMAYIQPLAPPADDTVDNTTFAGWVATEFMSPAGYILAAIASTATGYTGSMLAWTPRWSGGQNSKPNPCQPQVRYSIDARECRYTFSALLKAVGAYIVFVMWHAGYLPRADASNTGGPVPGGGYQDVAEYYGFSASDILAYATYSADGSIPTYFPTIFTSFRVMTDKIPLSQGRMCDWAMCRGFWADYEPTDRDPATTIFLTEELGRLLHAKGFFFGVKNDATTGTNAAGSGLDATSIYQIHQSPLVDYMNIQVSPAGKADVTTVSAQIDMFRGPSLDQPVAGSKIALQVGMGGYGNEISVPDATACNRAARTYGLHGIMEWFDLGEPGGDPTRAFNQAEAVLAGLPPPS